jgi:hypothetical protein
VSVAKAGSNGSAFPLFANLRSGSLPPLAPALSEQRLSLTAGGKVRYQLKTPYNDGTTHVVFEPLDFLARLAALVPRPRVNLTRYHGVFAPNSAPRALVAKGPGQGKGKEAHDRLATVCDWFTEGFDISDLKEVKALLDKLES